MTPFSNWYFCVNKLSNFLRGQFNNRSVKKVPPTSQNGPQLQAVGAATLRKRRIINTKLLYINNSIYSTFSCLLINSFSVFLMPEQLKLLATNCPSLRGQLVQPVILIARALKDTNTHHCLCAVRREPLGNYLTYLNQDGQPVLPLSLFNLRVH